MGSANPRKERGQGVGASCLLQCLCSRASLPTCGAAVVSSSVEARISLPSEHLPLHPSSLDLLSAHVASY
jgi:hypothetical protein